MGHDHLLTTQQRSLVDYIRQNHPGYLEPARAAITDPRCRTYIDLAIQHPDILEVQADHRTDDVSILSPQPDGTQRVITMKNATVADEVSGQNVEALEVVEDVLAPYDHRFFKEENRSSTILLIPSQDEGMRLDAQIAEGSDAQEILNTARAGLLLREAYRAVHPALQLPPHILPHGRVFDPFYREGQPPIDDPRLGFLRTTQDKLEMVDKALGLSPLQP